MLNRVLIFIGFVLVILGLIFVFLGKLDFIGKLPGDVVFKKGNFVFYFPLGTSILISLVLTLILFLFSIFKN
ncbi:MAG: hypothetical protein KatS3mg088_147 [Patescibacteria group bacterium]|nr:MAG: hypothetical protein KatS3mg088_147 [Patescibacteria group bacterium]